MNGKFYDGLPITYGQGAVAGFVAGLVMSAWKMGLEFLAGNGLWGPPKLVGTILLGSSAYDGGHDFRFAPVMVGMLLHELTSVGMGLVYVPLVRNRVIGRFPILTAVVYAFISWIGAQYILIPLLSPTMSEHTSPIGFAIAHIIFGLTLGLYAVWIVRHHKAGRIRMETI